MSGYAYLIKAAADSRPGEMNDDIQDLENQTEEALKVKNVILQNSDFLFGFEAVMTNPNGDPDQENRPRMDYETATTLVSDARRKRDCRDILKRKGYAIFVDTFDDNKIPMDRMFEVIIEKWLTNKN